MDTTVAQVEVPEDNDTAAIATHTNREKWGTKEAAQEIMKVQNVKAFLDSILTTFGLILESILHELTGTTINETPKKRHQARRREI